MTGSLSINGVYVNIRNSSGTKAGGFSSNSGATTLEYVATSGSKHIFYTGAANERLRISDSSPHVTVTGDLSVSGNLTGGTHNHTGVYATSGHGHAGYASSSHDHFQENWSGSSGSYGLKITLDSSSSGDALYGVTGYGYGVRGKSDYAYGVFGETTGSTSGIAGVYGGTSASDCYGVYGNCTGANGGRGVYGRATGSSTGVWGEATSGVGGWFVNNSASSYAVYAYNNNGATAPGIYVRGNAQITGSLTKGSGTFLIDHPLDPKNKVLRHSFIEGPEMTNIYKGRTKLVNGVATIELPSYFDALNHPNGREIILTPINGWSPLYLDGKIKDNKFTVKTTKEGNPEQEFSWVILAVRNDAFARQNPIVVEEEKGTGTATSYKKGEYIHAKAFGIEQAINPEEPSTASRK
ncbi:hypothetical protein ES703_123383 [subsurface metagenome]